MRSKGTTRFAGLLAMAGLLCLSSGLAYSQTQTGVFSGQLGSEATTPANVSGALGPRPGAAASGINNYVNQDEQLNLDANTGNIRVLRTNEKAALNDYVTATFPVKNASVRELRSTLRTVLALEGGAVNAIRDKKTGDHFLQVICPSFVLPYIAPLIAKLDVEWIREFDTGSADIYYKAKNRRAADIDFIAARFASENGFSLIDTTNNASQRIDEPYRIETYAAAAKVVDIPANQVLLEVEIIEVTSSNDLKVGLDYIAWKNGPGRNLFNFVYQAFDSQSRNDNFTSIYDPFSSWDPGAAALGAGTNQVLHTDIDQYYRSINYLLPSSYIDFLQVKGAARVMHKETLQVKSANTAFISAEDQILALVSSPSEIDEIGATTLQGVAPSLTRVRAGNGLDGNNEPNTINAAVRNTNRQLNYSNAGATGIFVELTPFVGLETMELVVDIEVGDLTGLAPNGQPIIGTRTMSTTARLVDGEPYILATLKRSNNIEESAKAPWLGDLPLLGYLFGGETDINRDSNVIIQVTPHFYVSSQTDLGLTASAQSIKDEISNGAKPAIPGSTLGFDQWLLDPNKDGLL